jgi:DnaJ like chaperone protein
MDSDLPIWRRLVAGFRALFCGGRRQPPERSVAFAVAVIALAAKMAKADGRVTHDEIRVFRESFHVDRARLAEVARVFDLARRSTSGFETYARKLGRMFADDPVMCEEILDMLFLIAEQDGGVHDSELRFLEATASAMGLDARSFARIRAGRGDDHGAAPHVVLGVAPDAPLAEIKAAWRALVRDLHPDRLVAAGMPPEFVAHARDRLVAVNLAYETLTGQRRAPRLTAARRGP